MKIKFKKILTILLTFGLLISLTACGESKIKTVSYSFKNKFFSLVVNEAFDEVEKENIDKKELAKIKKEFDIGIKYIDKLMINYNFDEDTQKLSNIVLNANLDCDIICISNADKKAMKVSIKNMNEDFKLSHKQFLKSVKKDKKFKKYRKMDFNIKYYYNEEKNILSFKVIMNKEFIKYGIDQAKKEKVFDKSEIKESEDMLTMSASKFKKEFVKRLDKDIKKLDSDINPKDCYKVKVVKY